MLDPVQAGGLDEPDPPPQRRAQAWIARVQAEALAEAIEDRPPEVLGDRRHLRVRPDAAPQHGAVGRRVLPYVIEIGAERAAELDVGWLARLRLRGCQHARGGLR